MSRDRHLAPALALTCALALALARPDLARAQRAEPPPPITERSPYDGRAPEPDGGEDALLWIPRVLLAPFRFVLGLSREVTRLVLEPIASAASSPDAREPAPPPLYALPTVVLASESSPAIGVRLRALPATALRIDAALAHWDDARLEGALAVRLALDERTALRAAGEGSTRGDRIFHGLGWSTPGAARTRYRHHRGGAIVALDVAGAPGAARLGVSLAGRVTHHRVEGSDHGGAREPSLDAAPDELAAQARAGLAGGRATVLEPRVALALDTRGESRRAPRSRSEGGVALALALAAGADVEGGARWLRAEASAAAAVVIAPEHDLTLAARVASVERASETAVPFVELEILGGAPGALAGFPYGRLHGESSAVAHLRYRWGIASRADAALHFEVGDVFGRALSDFDLERARASIGASIEEGGGGEETFALLFAFATDPFVLGGAPSSAHVRFSFGAPSR